VLTGGVPTLEGHVDMGAGAKIIDRLKVGKHAKIGANAVVPDDVPGGRDRRGRPGEDRPTLGLPAAREWPAGIGDDTVVTEV
jgi:serine O-acetyltransferase